MLAVHTCCSSQLCPLAVRRRNRIVVHRPRWLAAGAESCRSWLHDVKVSMR